MATVRIEPRARDDIFAAHQQYLDLDSTLGARFASRLDQRLTQLSRFPELGAVWPLVPGLRRLSMLTFPYWIAYEVTLDEVVVWALAHHRQRPTDWRR